MWLALCLLLTACGKATWSDALHDAEAQPGLSIARAELRFVWRADAATALNDAEQILKQAPAGSPDADRAMLLMLEASRATGELERALPYLADALQRTTDPVLGERFASELDRYWGRLDGGSPKQGLSAADAVVGYRGDAWEPARGEAALQALTMARRNERGALTKKMELFSGLVTEWRMSAPWGRTTELDLERQLGPETRSLKDEEQTGAGWNLRPTFTTKNTFSDGEATFFDMAQIGGIGFAEAAQPLPTGTLRLRLETNRLAKVYLGTRLVAARTDPTSPWSVTVVVSRLDERLLVKLASADGTGFFRVRVSPLEQPGVEAPLAPPTIAVGDAQAFVRSLALLDRQISRPFIDVAGARATLAALRSVSAEHPAVELLAARFARIDARVPVATQRVEARAHLDAVVRQWPGNPVARRALARLEKEEQHVDRALALLDTLEPDARTLLEKLEIQRERGWEADALDTLQALRAKANGVRFLQEAIDTERIFGRIAEASQDLVALQREAPNAAFARAAELATDAGDPNAAAAFYERAFTIAPERHALLRSAIAAWRASGAPASLEAAVRALDAYLERYPFNPWALSERARVRLQMGARDAAIAELKAMLERYPELVPIELLLALIDPHSGGIDPELEAGPDVVASYRADEATKAYAQFPIVSLLERTRIRVESDGSTMEVQHRIRLVQSRAGADALGDFRPPDGARLLVARTLKADGRLLYPERTEGKAELSFPELQIGDAVETAWIVRSRVSPIEGGYLTGISFAGWSAPTWKQEVVVVLPTGMVLRPTYFGDAPQPVVSGTTYTWQRTYLPAVPREPQAIGARSFFPFADLRVTTDADPDPWLPIAEMFAGRLGRVLAPGPRTLARARELKTAEAAFAWVKSDLEDSEQLNTFETPVESVIVGGKGHRAAALVALLRAQGRDAQLWLCAPERDGPPPDRAAPTPNTNRFFYPIVLTGKVVLDPSRPWMPWDALPPELYGAACLVPERVATGQSLFAELRAADPEQPPSFETLIDLSLGADGDARVQVRGLARGVAAVALRQLWTTIDDDKRRALWEQWAGTLASGARLVRYHVDDIDDPMKPMRWELELAFPSWARVSGGVIEVDKPLPPMVTADFASMPELSQLVALPARQTPLRVPAHSERVAVSVHVPRGFGVAAGELPPAFDERFGENRLVQASSVTGDGLRFERSVRFVPGRVEPADYARFKAFIDGADRGMSTPIRAVRSGR